MPFDSARKPVHFEYDPTAIPRVLEHRSNLQEAGDLLGKAGNIAVTAMALAPRRAAVKLNQLLHVI